jgi:hypothetical protein
MNGQSSHASCGGCGSSKKVYTPPVTRTPFALLSLTTGVSLFPSKTTRKPCCTACEEGDAPCGCGACGSHPQSPGDVFTLAPPMKVRWREQDDWDLPTRFVLSRAGSPSAVGLRSAFKPVLAQPKFPPPRPRKTEKAPPPPGVPFGISAGGKTGAAKRKGPQIIRRNIERELTLGDAMAWIRGLGDQSRLATFAELATQTRIAVDDMAKWMGFSMARAGSSSASVQVGTQQYGMFARYAPTVAPCDSRSRGWGHPVSAVGVGPPDGLPIGHPAQRFAQTVGLIWIEQAALLEQFPDGPLCIEGDDLRPDDDKLWSPGGVTGILISPSLFLTCAHGGATTRLRAYGARRGSVSTPIQFPRGVDSTEITKDQSRSTGLVAMGVYFDFYHRGAVQDDSVGDRTHSGFAGRSARVDSLVDWGPDHRGLDYAILSLRRIPDFGGRDRGFARMRGWDMTEGNSVFEMGFPSGAPMRLFAGEVDDTDYSCLEKSRDGGDVPPTYPRGHFGAEGFYHDVCMGAKLGGSSGVSGAAWQDSNGCVRGVNGGADNMRTGDSGRTYNYAMRLTAAMRRSSLIRELLAEQSPRSGDAIPFHYRHEGDGRYEHIFFRAEGGAGFNPSLMQLSRKAGVAWALRDLTVLTSIQPSSDRTPGDPGPPAPALGAAISGWWDLERERTNLVYPSDRGRLVHISGNPGLLRVSTWEAEDLLTHFGQWQTLHIGACTAWRNRDNNVAHVVATGRMDGVGPVRVAEFWRVHRWESRDLGRHLNLPEPAERGGLTSWFDAGQHNSHFAYVGRDSRLYHAWRNRGGWSGHREVHPGPVTGRVDSNFHDGNQRIVFQVNEHLIQAYYQRGAGAWQIRDFSVELPNLPSLRERDAELVVVRGGPSVFYISARARVVRLNLRQERWSVLPSPQSPHPGEFVPVSHIGSRQRSTGFVLVGTGQDGQVYWWDNTAANGSWHGFSLLARTGWPAGWLYDPQLGRVRQ